MLFRIRIQRVAAAFSLPKLLLIQKFSKEIFKKSTDDSLYSLPNLLIHKSKIVLRRLGNVRSAPLKVVRWRYKKDIIGGHGFVQAPEDPLVHFAQTLRFSLKWKEELF